MLVAESNRGTFTGYTFFRGEKPGYFQQWRNGEMLYGE